MKICSFSDIIEPYSREQAIADGLLIDITTTANEAGFKLPVAITNAVWSNYVEWSSQDSKRQVHQSTNARLWDILWTLRLAIQKQHKLNQISYSLNTIPRDGKTCQTHLISLKAVLNSNNDQSAMTIMLPNQD